MPLLTQRRPEPEQNPSIMGFLEAAEEWCLHASAGQDASSELARMRKIAGLLFSGPGDFSPREG